MHTKQSTPVSLTGKYEFLHLKYQDDYKNRLARKNSGVRFKFYLFTADSEELIAASQTVHRIN